ncbi:MAG: type II secretion system protein GspG [Leptospiraceae bacterium]|nr:type II secretion system protein GspG [Leptospiraceae bacterium]MCP5502755.1 type II secretion system protein GspG [Leptospiraceae bacterium]
MITGKLRRKIRRGLTLVELSVVVLILGAIIALVALNINPGQLKDDTASLKLRKDANELMMHLERYAAAYGKYPSEEQGLSALVEKPSVGDVPEDYKPIIKNRSAVLDPWGTPYKLKMNQDSGDPEIWTLGKDKADGGTGKNQDFNINAPDTYPKAFRKKGQ